ncbi:MAG: ankyrin repeat domain-containing protein [Verrucomicrobiae bacterium]|nr:ankyrin repeat domain-containing protein [Verrucomicrobiae bacterium]
MLAGAAYVVRGALGLDAVFTYDSPTYLEFDFSKGVLDNARTFGYPLLLRGIACLAPDYWLVPLVQTLLHVLAVLVFWQGLRRTGFSAWAAAITALPLYFSRTVALYGSWVLTDAPGLSLALATMGTTLIAVSSPKRSAGWVALAVVLFLAYITRPAYVFLIGFVPVVGIGVGWLRRLAIADLRSVALKIVAVCFVPFLLFCALRWLAVGHFGLVSAGGVNAIGIAAEMLDSRLCETLPPHLRPIALRIQQERDVFFPRRYITRRWIDMTVPEDWFNYNVHFISYPLMVAFCGTDTVRTVNDRLSELCTAVFRQAPVTYGLWIAFSFARDAMGIWRWLRWELLCLAGLLVVTAGLCWASGARCGQRGLRRLLPSDAARRELGVILLVGLGFYGASLLLVAMVELPYSRYADACHLFLPALVAYGFVGAARSLRNSARVLRGTAICESADVPDAEPTVERKGQGRAGCCRRVVGRLAFCGVVVISGWIGWRVFAGSRDGVERFLNAAQHGDSIEGARMLEQDPGWARRSSAHGVSGLHIAAIHGQQAVVELLLRRGADAGATDRDGLTPLHWAAVAGQTAVVENLLAHGADANAASRGGIRPIHLARMTTVVNALIKAGAKLDVADHRGLGPLHWALEPDAVTALVKAGANPNKILRDPAGAPAVPALHFAVKKINRPLGKSLLEAGADPNFRDAQGRTALFASVEWGCSLLDDLLAHRADASVALAVGIMSKWQLHIGNVAAFVNREDDMTALHWATLYDSGDIVRKLAASVRDVNIRSRLGLTPLHWAAGANKPQAVLALLACGADPSIKNNAGQTAADLAARTGNVWLVKTLRDATSAARRPAEGQR